MPRSFARACAALLLSAVLAAPAAAQESFPSRGPRFIVPFPPGSSLDWTTRIMAEHLTRMWGRQIIVENVAGAGGNLGAQRVARAEPDGHTLLFSPPGPLLLNKMLLKDTNYEAEKFVPITLLTQFPNVLVVRNDMPVKTLAEYIERAKANPGRQNYASQGPAATGYMTSRTLEMRTNIQMLHVPYRGGAAILADLAAGHVDSFFDAAPTSVPLHLGGKARIIAVAGPHRLASLPDVPTASETVPDFNFGSFTGVVAPEGTPAALVQKIYSDLASVILSPDVAARFRQIYIEPVASNPAETAKLFAEEKAKWTKVIRDIGVQAE